MKKIVQLCCFKNVWGYCYNLALKYILVSTARVIFPCFRYGSFVCCFKMESLEAEGCKEPVSQQDDIYLSVYMPCPDMEPKLSGCLMF